MWVHSLLKKRRLKIFSNVLLISFLEKMIPKFYRVSPHKKG